jgi:hypothetical protein
VGVCVCVCVGGGLGGGEGCNPKRRTRAELYVAKPAGRAVCKHVARGEGEWMMGPGLVWGSIPMVEWGRHCGRRGWRSLQRLDAVPVRRRSEVEWGKYRGSAEVSAL